MEEKCKRPFFCDKRVRATIVVIAVIIAFAAGHRTTVKQPPPGDVDMQAEAAATIWTCSMDPQIRMHEPGACPICGMALIPLETSGIIDRQIEFTDAAKKLMQVETAVAERKFVSAEIRMVGKVAYDETGVKYITAWVPGRIDRLFADYTGMTVKKGDHMVELYSPDLLSAQAELLQAVKSGSSSNYAAATLEAARKKLELLGLNQEQIKQIEKSSEPVEHITINAPTGGVVIHKNATEGMYVETGTQIYTIADLSQLWVKLDAYESDVKMIRYGQQVEFTTEAYPGETFAGSIIFIDPALDPETRTVKVRVNVANPDNKLKPEMFVRAVVRPRLAEDGKVLAKDMAGKWVCPMHNEIVKDSAGTCDICQMPLESAESLGFVNKGEDHPPLVIPASAPLITGARAVVYVQVPDMEKPTYEGREVVLGSRAGDYYIVESGLAEGDVVVTKGNFKIDSAMQIQAKPSMMSPPKDNSEKNMLQKP